MCFWYNLVKAVVSYYAFSFSYKLAFCDVIIPGRESEIHLRMPFDVTKLQKKSKADNVSGTMLFYQMSNIDNGVCPTYKMAIETPKWSMEVPFKY